MRTLITTILTLVILYLGILLCFYFFQGRLVFHPRKEIISTPADLGLDFEKIKCVIPGKPAITGWYLNQENTQKTLLYCHGNAGNLSTHLDHIAAIYKTGVNVFIFDYQGFGETPGKPTEANTYKDALTAYEYLTQVKKITPKNIILYGHSLGGAIASKIATKVETKGLILEGTFTDINELGAELYPYLPVKKLSKVNYNSIKNIKSITVPILIIHSIDDEVIPYKYGQELFKAAPEPKSFLEVEGRHDETYIVSRYKYRDGISAFINSLWLEPVAN
jgi:uncharacterized protein